LPTASFAYNILATASFAYILPTASFAYNILPTASFAYISDYQQRDCLQAIIAHI